MEGKALRLAGAHEVRDLLGVSRQRVYQLAARPDFPDPVATLAQGKVWSIDDIEKWLADHRRRPEEVDVGVALSAGAAEADDERLSEVVGVGGG